MSVFKLLHSFEVEYYMCTTLKPTRWYLFAGLCQSTSARFAIDSQFIPALDKALVIVLATGTIYEPDQGLIEGFTGPSFGWIKKRMLKFNGESVWCEHVCAVYFTTVFVLHHGLLPVNRKFVLPLPMPFRFVFPPWVAIAFAFVCPVVQILLTTAGYNFRTATRASANAAFEGLCARIAE